MKKKLIIIIPILTILIILAIVFIPSYIKKAKKYDAAIENLNNKEYEDAYNAFKELGNFKDAKEYYNKFEVKYLPTSKKHIGIHTDTTDYVYDADYNLVSEFATENIQTVDDIITRTVRTEYKYNSNGLITEETQTTQGDSTPSVTKYEYDSNNLLTKKTFISHLSSGEINEAVTSYKYNSEGLLIEETYEPAKRVTKYEYNGTLLSRQYSDSKETTYSYDDKDRLTSETTTWSDGTIRTISYEYNKDDVVTKELWETIENGKSGVVNVEYTYNIVYIYNN